MKPILLNEYLSYRTFPLSFERHLPLKKTLQERIQNSSLFSINLTGCGSGGKGPEGQQFNPFSCQSVLGHDIEPQPAPMFHQSVSVCVCRKCFMNVFE